MALDVLRAGPARMSRAEVRASAPVALTPVDVGRLTGAFDLVTVAQLDVIEQARGRCDRLVARVHTDAQVQRIEGLAPVMPLDERVSLVAALRDRGRRGRGGRRRPVGRTGARARVRLRRRLLVGRRRGAPAPARRPGRCPSCPTSSCAPTATGPGRRVRATCPAGGTCSTSATSGSSSAPAPSATAWSSASSPTRRSCAAKGRPPMVPFAARAAVVAAVGLVDEVVADASSNKLLAWERVGFDVLFKGDDWRGTAKGDRLEAEMARSGSSCATSRTPRTPPAPRSAPSSTPARPRPPVSARVVVGVPTYRRPERPGGPAARCCSPRPTTSGPPGRRAGRRQRPGRLGARRAWRRPRDDRVHYAVQPVPGIAAVRNRDPRRGERTTSAPTWWR